MFKANAKVDVALNRDVEHLIKTGGKEGILPIVQMGEPVLRQRTVPYEGQLSRRTLTKLIETMRTTMLEAPGVGLAGPPVGDQTRSFYEGCLSFAGYQAVRRRWLDIIARWQDEDGNRHEERLHGWPARIFQHETDHLSGEVYIDRAEIRSLSSDENLADLWCEDPVPTEAAEELGFDL